MYIPWINRCWLVRWVWWWDWIYMVSMYSGAWVYCGHFAGLYSKCPPIGLFIYLYPLITCPHLSLSLSVVMCSWLWRVGSPGQDHWEEEHVHRNPVLDGPWGDSLRPGPHCHLWLQSECVDIASLLVVPGLLRILSIQHSFIFTEIVGASVAVLVWHPKTLVGVDVSLHTPPHVHGWKSMVTGRIDVNLWLQ